MVFEAAESGNNSITEESTNENEETEDSTGAEDEKVVRDNFSKDKMFWNVGMFVHPKTMLIYILYSSYGICELQEFELEEVIFYTKWFSMHMST